MPCTCGQVSGGPVGVLQHSVQGRLAIAVGAGKSLQAETLPCFSRPVDGGNARLRLHLQRLQGRRLGPGRNLKGVGRCPRALVFAALDHAHAGGAPSVVACGQAAQIHRAFGVALAAQQRLGKCSGRHGRLHVVNGNDLVAVLHGPIYGRALQLGFALCQHPGGRGCLHQRRYRVCFDAQRHRGGNAADALRIDGAHMQEIIAIFQRRKTRQRAAKLPAAQHVLAWGVLADADTPALGGSPCRHGKVEPLRIFIQRWQVLGGRRRQQRGDTARLAIG